jgi:hypothetical protein
MIILLFQYPPAINNGTNPGSVDSFSLTPIYQYVHPTAQTTRVSKSKLDIGANGYGNSTGIPLPENSSGFDANVFPNPSNGNFNVSVRSNSGSWIFTLYTIKGSFIAKQVLIPGNETIQFHIPELTPGLYILNATDLAGYQIGSLIVVIGK